MKTEPPIWANKLLEWFCSEEQLDILQGDIHELYEWRLKKHGKIRARLHFIKDVLDMLRPFAVKRKNSTFKINHLAMFNHYLKTTIRSFSKNKAFSLINVLGLALALATCYFIYIYVKHERSYDNFHTNGDRIYRVTVDRYHDGHLSQQWAAASAAIGPALKDNFPEVTEFVKIHRGDVSTLAYGDAAYREERAFFATGAFFNVFSYNLISGTDSLVLKNPYTVAISSSTAKKYFKDKDPIGEILRLNGKHELLVTGVFEDVPENTHMKFDVLYSFETLVSMQQFAPDEGNGDVRWSWGAYGFYTYILLDQNSNAQQLISKIPALVDREYGSVLKEQNKRLDFHLQPIKDIHLNSNLMREFEANGSESTVLIITIIALFILVIAWINYINLATAKSIDRAKEIGVKKILGSGKSLLVKQFLFESLMINISAATLAVLLVVLLIPEFNQISGQHMNLNILLRVDFWMFFTLLALIGTFLAGFYPAVVLSQFKPISVIKGKFSRSIKGGMIRKSLVVIQFVTSIVLMVGVFIIYKQVDFMHNQSLGIDIEKTLVLKGPRVFIDSTYYKQHNSFKTMLLSNPSISYVTVSSEIPGSPPNGSAGSVKLVGDELNQGKAYLQVRFDFDFVEAYSLQIMAGNNFSRELGRAVWGSVIFNESAVIQMGFDNNENAIGRMMELYPGGPQLKIIGVINDYHQESLKSNVEPTIYFFHPLGNYYSLKVAIQNLPATIEAIKNQFNAFFPGNEFDYFFLDDHYNQQYQAELTFSKVVNIATVLALIIACMGLFGLSTYTVIQRMKEISIRKVLGASVNQIFTLLISDFTRLITAAIVIGLPLAWYFMDGWLDNFAFRASLNWTVFVVPALLLLGVALLTITFHVLKAAVTNPAETLKDE